MGGSQPGAYPDNGETPLSSAGLLPEGMGTIGSAEPLSFQIGRLSSAGFSMPAIRRAISSQLNLSPVVKAFTVSGGIGHAAINATLAGETLWWSHGGINPWYGVGTYNHGKLTPYSELQFIDSYLKLGYSVTSYTLNLTPAQALGVAQSITARIDVMPHGYANPKSGYGYNEASYNCSQSVMDILVSAGVTTRAWPSTTPILIAPYLSSISSRVDEYLMH